MKGLKKEFERQKEKTMMMIVMMMSHDEYMT